MTHAQFCAVFAAAALFAPPATAATAGGAASLATSLATLLAGLMGVNLAACELWERC